MHKQAMESTLYHVHMSESWEHVQLYDIGPTC